MIRPAPSRSEVNGGPLIGPPDEHNRTLVANVHPPDWQNPEPAGRYNLVVLGAGTAGLVTAAGAAGLGAKVAPRRKTTDGRRLFERRLRTVEGADPRGARPPRCGMPAGSACTSAVTSRSISRR